MQPFIHLHVHSQYSILDGQASIPALVDKAIRDGMKGLALTDHGNMFGINDLGSFFTIQQKKLTAFCLIATKKFFFFIRTVRQTGNDTKISLLFRFNSFSYR